MNPRDLHPTLKPDAEASGTASAPASTNPAEAGQAQTLRALAEAVKLGAEANESRARQLRELEYVAEWLQRGLTAEAGRLEPAAGEPRTPGMVSENTPLEPRRLEAARLAKLETRAESLEQENHRLRASLNRFESCWWPKALAGDAWRPWRDHLLERAVSDAASDLLLARLHLAAAWERTGRPLPLELARDIGRSVYEAGGDEAERLAQALTQAASGRFEIRTVRVGDRVDNKFMKPAVSALVDVHSVASWAVRDPNGLWQFPAEVS